MGVCSEDAKFRHGIGLILWLQNSRKTKKTKKKQKQKQCFQNYSDLWTSCQIFVFFLFFLFFCFFSRVFFFSDGAVVKCTDERGVHEADAWL